jgi:hypothetical protein
MDMEQASRDELRALVAQQQTLLAEQQATIATLEARVHELERRLAPGGRAGWRVALPILEIMNAV